MILLPMLDVSEDFQINGNKIHLTMLHNPSHLEAVNPVSMGKTRSKQQTLRDGAFSSDAPKHFGSNVINVQVFFRCFFLFLLIVFIVIHHGIAFFLLIASLSLTFALCVFRLFKFSCTVMLHSVARE